MTITSKHDISVAREKVVRPFKQFIAIGERGEELVHTIMTGRLTCEVKTDFVARKTGNLYIEYLCRGKPSGISVSQADMWCFVTEAGVMFFPTEPLRCHLRIGWRKNKYPIIHAGDDNLSEGMLVPISDLMSAKLSTAWMEKIWESGLTPAG